jgi:spore coat protein U-like protein
MEFVSENGEKLKHLEEDMYISYRMQVDSNDFVFPAYTPVEVAAKAGDFSGTPIRIPVDISIPSSFDPMDYIPGSYKDTITITISAY